MEAVLNSGNGGQKAQGSEREHDGQREEAAGRSQLQQLRTRGIAQYLRESRGRPVVPKYWAMPLLPLRSCCS